MQLRTRNKRWNRWFLSSALFCAFFVFFAPSLSFAQTDVLPCDVAEDVAEAEKQLARDRETTKQLEITLARLKQEETTKKDYVSKTIRIKVFKNGVFSSTGAGTVIGCSPSESEPGKLACFIFSVAHFLKDEQKNRLSLKEVSFKAQVFKGDAVVLDDLPIQIIGIDFDNDVSLMLVRVDAPLPAAPLPPQGYRPPLLGSVSAVGCADGAPKLYTKPDTCIFMSPNEGEFRTNCAPKPGDSGGGAFDSQGRVIGTCLSYVSIGGIPQNIGVYAVSDHVRKLLEGAQARGSYKNVGFNAQGYMQVMSSPKAVR